MKKSTPVEMDPRDERPRREPMRPSRGDRPPRQNISAETRAHPQTLAHASGDSPIASRARAAPDRCAGSASHRSCEATSKRARPPLQ